MTEHSIPFRKCMACGERKAQSELIRFVRTDDGILLDRSKKADGRGAYLCPDRSCAALLFKKHGLDRAFHMKVSEKELERLQSEVSEFLG